MKYRNVLYAALWCVFVLPAMTTVAAPGCFTRSIGCSSKVFETLNATSCVNTAGNRIDVYRFTWLDGDYVTMTQKSAAFVPWVAIGDGAQTVLDYDRSPRNDTSELVFRLPYTGEYFIYAGTLNPGQFGAYSLEVRCSRTPPPPPCAPPSILAEPLSQRVPRGSRAELTVSASGTSLSFWWYRGNRGDTSELVPYSLSDRLTTYPIFAKERYWVRVKNQCGSADSQAAEITPTLAKRRAARH